MEIGKRFGKPPRRRQFGRTRDSALGTSRRVRPAAKKNHERKESRMGGPVLQEQALQAGVVRVGSGQGWILLRETKSPKWRRFYFRVPITHQMTRGAKSLTAEPHARQTSHSFPDSVS